MALRRSTRVYATLFALLPLATACGSETPSAPSRDDRSSSTGQTLEPARHAGLRSPARVVIDKRGIPHLFAASENDVAYLQGYVTARDRLFQMDVLRRQADGTLAELVGTAALSSDVQLRTFGVRRASELSLPLLSPEVRAALSAYAAGVNAVASASPLPREYAALELTDFRPWTEIDSVSIVKLLTFQLSFDISDMQATLALASYQAAGQQRGFDGTALYFADTNRVAPFDPASTVPDALRAPIRPPRRFERASAGTEGQRLSRETLRLVRAFLDQFEAAPFAKLALRSDEFDRGSNQFLVSGRLSATGRPLIANDPHLAAMTPAIFYQVHLHAPAAGIDALGASFAGAPYLVLGNSERVAWTATTTLADVTDVYQETVVADPNSPSGFSTLYQGVREPIVPLPQTFRFNMLGDGAADNLSVQPPGGPIPPAVLIVPRRNQGPIVQFNPTAGTAISVQYTGSVGTRELDTFRGFVRARNLRDFERSLATFDVGSQNFAAADVNGDIAYFFSGEVPLREDLQAGKVSGLPPMFIRNGEGGNEWIKAASSDATRALPFEVLPAGELPRLFNPPRGFLVNSNNDPSGETLDNDPFNELRPGGGIRYIGARFDTGVRAGRITDLLDERARRGRLTTSDLKTIQADTVMKEARYFTPFILAAFENAKTASAHPALRQAAADPRVIEAVARLAAWDQSTPTGIREGFDANDTPGNLREPSAEEIRHSVATTIYSVWRNQLANDVVVATLTRQGLTLFNTSRREVLSAARNLLDGFDENRGIGASGVDFFVVPGIDDANTRRDVILLRSLAKALDLLAGDTYAPVFGRSTNQDDYRWGRLHRVRFPHPLGGAFSTPPAFGAFPAPLGPDLPGIPIDGGLHSVDIGNFQILNDADPVNAFTVIGIPVQRYVARVRPFGLGFDVENSQAGGQSGVPGTAFYLNLLEPYLMNETYRVRQTLPEIFGSVSSSETFLPAR